MGIESAVMKAAGKLMRSGVGKCPILGILDITLY